MTMFVRSLALLGAILVGVACGTSVPKDETASVLSKEKAMISEVDRLAKEFADLKADRNVSEGWATYIRPGDTRSTEQVVNDLLKMEAMQAMLEKLGPSDRTGQLAGDIRQVMIEDLRMVLRMASRENELSALGQFLRIAPTLDTSLEQDFGVKAEELRVAALKMARKEVERQRVAPSEANPIANILHEWQFTPQELGLTAEDLKSANIRQ